MFMRNVTRVLYVEMFSAGAVGSRSINETNSSVEHKKKKQLSVNIEWEIRVTTVRR